MRQFLRDCAALIALIGGISLIAYLLSDGSSSSPSSAKNSRQAEREHTMATHAGQVAVVMKQGMLGQNVRE